MTPLRELLVTASQILEKRQDTEHSVGPVVSRTRRREPHLWTLPAPDSPSVMTSAADLRTPPLPLQMSSAKEVGRQLPNTAVKARFRPGPRCQRCLGPQGDAQEFPARFGFEPDVETWAASGAGQRKRDCRCPTNQCRSGGLPRGSCYSFPRFLAPMQCFSNISRDRVARLKVVSLLFRGANIGCQSARRCHHSRLSTGEGEGGSESLCKDWQSRELFRN